MSSKHNKQSKRQYKAVQKTHKQPGLDTIKHFSQTSVSRICWLTWKDNSLWVSLGISNGFKKVFKYMGKIRSVVKIT